jgi:hypothetical protein
MHIKSIFLQTSLWAISSIVVISCGSSSTTNTDTPTPSNHLYFSVIATGSVSEQPSGVYKNQECDSQGFCNWVTPPTDLGINGANINIVPVTDLDHTKNTTKYIFANQQNNPQIYHLYTLNAQGVLMPTSVFVTLNTVLRQAFTKNNAFGLFLDKEVAPQSQPELETFTMDHPGSIDQLSILNPGDSFAQANCFITNSTTLSCSILGKTQNNYVSQENLEYNSVNEESVQILHSFTNNSNILPNLNNANNFVNIVGANHHEYSVWFSYTTPTAVLYILDRSNPLSEITTQPVGSIMGFSVQNRLAFTYKDGQHYIIGLKGTLNPYVAPIGINNTGDVLTIGTIYTDSVTVSSGRFYASSQSDSSTYILNSFGQILGYNYDTHSFYSDLVNPLSITNYDGAKIGFYVLQDVLF